MIGQTIGGNAASKKKQQTPNIYQSYLNSGNVQLSDYDMMYASPNDQKAIANAKKGYLNATSDAEKSYYNKMANEARASSGYYGGMTGEEFVPILNLPEYKPYEYNEFKYNVNKDNIYKQYAEQFARQGQAAGERSLASASATTGGIPSSYAAAANAQAQQAYAQKTADIIPELEQNAYSRYLNERDFNYADYLNQYNNNRDSANAKYNSMINQRDFDYASYLNNQERSDRLAQQTIDNSYRQNTFDWQKDTDVRDFDYRKSQDVIQNALSQSSNSRAWAQFEYGKEQDSINRQLADEERKRQQYLQGLELNYPNTVMGRLEAQEQEAILKEKENNIRAAVSSALQAQDTGAWLRENAAYLSNDEYAAVIKIIKDYSSLSK